MTKDPSEDEWFEDFGAPAPNDEQLEALAQRARETGDVEVRRVAGYVLTLRMAIGWLLKRIEEHEGSEATRNDEQLKLVRVLLGHSKTLDDADKPTFASVTSARCTCSYLETAAEDAEVPIVFDAEMNEFHITSVGKNRGHSMIYHCPFCGGAAPESKRASFFAVVTRAEEERLRDLTRGFTTLDAVIEHFGKPDHDMQEGLTTRSAESDSEASKIKMYRSLHYLSLSEIAEVHFTDFGPDGGVRTTFQGKYLGRPSA